MRDGHTVKNQLFSIIQSKESGEFHIFISHKNLEDECEAENWSICAKMELGDQGDIRTRCKNDIMTRKVAADIGWPVCGTCVSHLYNDY